jgi:hypothetical protein
LFTTDQWADYLIYRHPEQKVFVDGPSDFYGPEIGNQYLRLMNGGWDWQKVMEKNKFDVALLPVWGWGPISMPGAPGSTGTGPKWSAKHQAPTVRRARRGSARRTGTPPTSAARLGVSSTSGRAG